MDTRRKISGGEILLLTLTALFLCALTALALREQATEPDIYAAATAQTKAAIQEDEERTMLLDINDASAEELTELPGIGEKLAGKIVDYRNTYGPFTSEEDLLEVSGIGPEKLEQIRPYIRLRNRQS